MGYDDPNRLFDEALAMNRRGDARAATEALQRALRLFRDEGSDEGEARCLNSLGTIAFGLGEPERAVACLEEAVAAARRAGNRDFEGRCLGNLGLIQRDLGRPDEGVPLLLRALQLAREVGDLEGIANQLGNLGMAYSARGEVDLAIEQFFAALKVFYELGNHGAASTALVVIGETYEARGQLDRARFAFEEAADSALKAGDLTAQATAIVSLAGVEYLAGRPAASLELCEKARGIFRYVRAPRGEASSLTNMGVVHRTLGDLARAEACFQQALELNERIGHREGVAEDEGRLVTVRTDSGDAPVPIGTSGRHQRLFHLGGEDRSGNRVVE